MATIRIDFDAEALNALDKRVRLLTDQNLRFVAAKALNEAGGAAKQALRTAMPRFIERPVPYTVNSGFQRFAKASQLETTVGIADQSRSGRTPAAKYLLPIVKGTQPSLKGADQSATKIAREPRGAVLVPAKGSGLINNSGNVPLSKYATILGQARKGGGQYFIAPVKQGSSVKAVFERKEGFLGRTSTLQRTTRRLFTIEPNPKPRRPQFPVREILDRAFGQAWPVEVRRAFEAEVARKLGR
jgi:hypothetical protein